MPKYFFEFDFVSQIRISFFIALFVGAMATPARAEENPHEFAPTLGVLSSVSVLPSDGRGSLVLLSLGGELGVRPTEALELGFEASYGTSTGLVCAHCTAKSARVAINARAHFVRHAVVDPWLGGSVGYERLGLGPTLNATEQSSFGGIVFPKLQFGIDVHPVPEIAIGPFVSTEIVWYGPEAPSWLVTSLQVRADAGLRFVATF